MDQFLVVFSTGAAAVVLWEFGEDELADRALAVDDDQMLHLWRTAASYYDPGFPLPVTGRRVTLGHVIAFACMKHLDGELRSLARQRRRPVSTLPKRLAEAREAKDAELSKLEMRLTGKS